MKLTAQVFSELLAVPCQGTETVRWLADEAIRRYNKLNNASSSTQSATSSMSDFEPLEVRLTRGGARLDWDDSLSSVVQDNEFVTIGTVYT